MSENKLDRGSEDPVVNSVGYRSNARPRAGRFAAAAFASALMLVVAAGVLWSRSRSALQESKAVVAASKAMGPEVWTLAPDVHDRYWFATSKDTKDVQRQLGSVWRRTSKGYHREKAFLHKVAQGTAVAEQRKGLTYRYAVDSGDADVSEKPTVWVATEREPTLEFRLRDSAPAAQFGAKNAELCEQIGGTNDVLAVVAVRVVNGRVGSVKTFELGQKNPFVLKGYEAQLENRSYVEMEMQSAAALCSELRTAYIQYMVDSFAVASDKTAELARQLSLLERSLTTANEKLARISQELESARGAVDGVRARLDEPCKIDLSTCQRAIAELGGSANDAGGPP